MTYKMNQTIKGKTVYCLTAYDIIEENDLIRPLFESGGEGGFNTSYKPEGWDGLKWQPVKNDLSGWIGKTYKDYMEFSCDSDTGDYMSYEIIRIL